MPIPGITFQYSNNQLGGVNPSADGICGMILTGVAISPGTGATGLALNTPKAIFTLADAVAIGITAAYDTTNSTRVYADIADFYNKVAKGELWIMLVAQTATMADICDKTILTNAVKLLNAATGRIRVLALAIQRAAGYSQTTTTGLDADVFAAIPKAQALAVQYANTYYYPLRVVLPGYGWSGVAADLLDLTTLSANYVQVLLHGVNGKKSARIGFYMGLLASLQVQRNVGRVANGALGLTEAYLTDGATQAENIFGVQDTINDKGYVIPIIRPGKTGYFYNDDPMATAKTDDYCQMARCRVIDKVSRIAYTTYLDFVNDDYTYNTDGSISAADLKRLQGRIDDQVNSQMKSAGEVSNFSSFVDPTQDTTNGVTVQLRVQPKGYFKTIIVAMGFVKTI